MDVKPVSSHVTLDSDFSGWGEINLPIHQALTRNGETWRNYEPSANIYPLIDRSHFRLCPDKFDIAMSLMWYRYYYVANKDIDNEGQDSLQLITRITPNLPRCRRVDHDGLIIISVDGHRILLLG